MYELSGLLLFRKTLMSDEGKDWHMIRDKIKGTTKIGLNL